MILLNGELVENTKIILDSGLYFGRGLFETMLVNKAPLFLEQHLQRINKGLPIIGIERKITRAQVIEAVNKLQCTNGVLKLVVTEKNIIFTTRENKYTEERYKKGFKVKISTVKRNEFSKLTYLKSLNYLENILEHEKCIQEGYDEVLFFNTEDQLAEGSLSNVFFIKDKKIYTPSLACGLLDGVVRNFIINNFEVIEGKFSKVDLISSDSMFLTNSIMGVMRVSALQERSLNECRIIQRIQEIYQKQCE